MFLRYNRDTKIEGSAWEKWCLQPITLLAHDTRKAFIMANQEDIQKITLVDENGDEALYEVLFTFHSEEYGKDYILLVPEGVEDDEEVDIQAYIFNPDENGDATEEDLIQIEDDKEWDMVEEVLNTFLEDDSNFE